MASLYIRVIITYKMI